MILHVDLHHMKCCLSLIGSREVLVPLMQYLIISEDTSR